MATLTATNTKHLIQKICTVSVQVALREKSFNRQPYFFIFFWPFLALLIGQLKRVTGNGTELSGAP